MPEGKLLTFSTANKEEASLRETRAFVSGVVLLALWAALVIFFFFHEHPFKFSYFLRLLTNFHIPLQINPDKLLLSAKHLLLAGLLVFCGVLAGRLFLRAVGIRTEGQPPDKWEIMQHLMLALGLGWGLLMYATLILGMAGKLYPQALWLLMLIILAAGFPESRRMSRELRALFQREQREELPVLLKVGWLGLLVVAGSALIIALAPSITHDAMVYHLNVPRIYADSHRIVAIPYNLFSNTVLNMEMLYAMALSLDDFILANLLHFVMGLAALATLYAFARPRFGRKTASLAVFILFFNPLVLNQMSIAYVDLGKMFYFLLMMVCLWNWREKGGNRWFILLCVFSGIFAGIKYTSLHGLVAAGAGIVAIELMSNKRSVGGLLKRGCLFGGIVSVFVLPYLVKNYVMTGNPVYPLMYDLFGGKWLTPGQVERMLAYVNSHGMGRGWRDFALLPWNMTVLGKPGFEHFDAIITPLWLVFVPAFFLIRRRPAALNWALFICGVYFLSWMMSTHITRYLMPIFPLLSLICAYAAFALLEKTGQIAPVLGRVPAAAIACACAVTWFSFSFFYPLRAPSEFGAVVWGTQSRDEFLTKIVPGYPAFRYINDELPKNARFAFFWDNRGFFCERKQIGDSVFEAPSMLELIHQAGSADAFHKKLRSMRIGYILFNELFFSKFPPFPLSEEDKARLEADYAIMREFLKGYCLPFYSADGITLYAVHV